MRSPVDEVMAGWLRELNLDPATAFDWDQLSPEAQRGLERAAADAHRIIAQCMPRVVPIVNNWQVARLDKRLTGDPVIAAGAAMLGLLWNPAEISTYDIAFFDGPGARLDGGNRYVLRFAPPPPPVDGFWSVTMYSAQNQLFVPNKIDRYSFGDRTKATVYGADGSREVFLQHEEPTDPVERANWLPSPQGRFYLVTRHYSPRAPILTGDWVPPGVSKRQTPRRWLHEDHEPHNHRRSLLSHRVDTAGQRAVQAYIHYLPAAGFQTLCNAHFGPLGGKAGEAGQQFTARIYC